MKYTNDVLCHYVLLFKTKTISWNKLLVQMSRCFSQCLQQSAHALYHLCMGDTWLMYESDEIHWRWLVSGFSFTQSLYPNITESIVSIVNSCSWNYHCIAVREGDTGNMAARMVWSSWFIVRPLLRNQDVNKIFFSSVYFQSPDSWQW